MVIIYWLLGVMGWGACGVLAYGLTVGYFQNAYPQIAKETIDKDRRAGLSMAAMGPFGLWSIMSVNPFGINGFKW